MHLRTYFGLQRVHGLHPKPLTPYSGPETPSPKPKTLNSISHKPRPWILSMSAPSGKEALHGLGPRTLNPKARVDGLTER